MDIYFDFLLVGTGCVLVAFDVYSNVVYSLARGGERKV